MEHLMPFFLMMFIIFVILGIGFYLKYRVHRIVALAFVTIFSAIVIIEMLPGALKAVFYGVLENAKNSTFPF